MGFGDFLDDVVDVGRSLNPFDDDDKKKKKPKKPKGAGKKGGSSSKKSGPKAPPLPVPSLEAGWRVASDLQLQENLRKIGYKPPKSMQLPKGAPFRPERKHLPLKYMLTPMEDLLFPPKPGSDRDKAIKAFNQEKEAERRAIAKGAKEEAKKARKAAEKARLAIPDRPGGWRGFIDDITEGRGALGLATTGPVSLFARDDARNALFHGNFEEAAKQALEIGRYRPPAPGQKLGRGFGQTAGPGRLTEWLGNVNRGVNTLPAMFSDVAQVAGTAAWNDYRNRRGIIGLATTTPAIFGDEKARKRLFSGDIEGALSQAFPDWDAPNSEGGKLSKEILVGAVADTKRVFSDPNYWYDDPVNAAFAAAIVLGPVSRATGIAKTMSRLAAIKDASAINKFKVAVAESFHPGVSGLQQGIRRQIPTGRGDETIDITAGRHPFGRALQRQYDLVTRAIDPDTRFIGGLAAPRRARRIEARRVELGQRRLQRDVNEANRKAALYINEGLVSKARVLTGDALRRGRDSAIVMALQGARDVDPVESVKYAINDTDSILERGTAYAPDGDIADLTVVPAGQEAFLDGEKVRITQTVVGQNGEPRATAVNAAGETIEGAASRFKLVNDETGERVRINLTDDQRARLNQRRGDLSEALDELLSNPKQRKKFEDAVKIYSQLGAINEDLGHVISRAMVGSEEWDNFLAGGRMRRSLMARRWRKQGLRAGEEEIVRPVVDVQERRDFMATTTERIGAEQAIPIMHLADNMAQSAAEAAAAVGRDFSAADWWKRIASTTSMRAADYIGEGLFHEGQKAIGTGEAGKVAVAGVREGLVRTSTMRPEVTGTYLPGSVAYQAADGSGRIFSGVTDLGDGNMRVWATDANGISEWTTVPKDSVGPRSLNYGDARDQPMQVGEKVGYRNFGDQETNRGTISGYAEHDENGPSIIILSDGGGTVHKRPQEVYRSDKSPQGPIFYSKAQTTVAALPEAEYTYERLMKAMQKAGIKKDDMYVTGLQEFAEMYREQGKPIPKEDLLEHMENSLNAYNIDETLFSSNSSQYPDVWGPNRGSSREGRLIIRDPTSEEPYYELVMRIPDKPGPAYNRSHFSGQTNYLLHVRFHLIRDEEGVWSVLIDELQSDVMNMARDEGWRELIPAAAQAEIDRLGERVNQLRRAQNEIPNGHYLRYNVEDARKQWVNERLDQEDAAFQQSIQDALASGGAYPEVGETRAVRFARLMRDTNWDDPEIKNQIQTMYPMYLDELDGLKRYERIDALSNRAAQKMNDLTAGYNTTGIPDYPWKNDGWMKLAMKRLARFAVDNDARRIYWLRGHEHQIRYSQLPDLNPQGSRDLNPSNYDDEFYNYHGSVSDDFGEAGATGNISAFTEEPLEGMNLALLETGEPPVQPRPMGGGERAILDPDDIPDGDQGQKYVMWNGRHAEIKDWLDEGEFEGNEHFEIEYLPAKYDPANVNIDAFAYGGGDDYRYTVTITNRLGEKFDIEIDSGATPYSYVSSDSYNAQHEFWQDVSVELDAKYGDGAVESAERQVANADKNLTEVQAKVDAGETLQHWESLESAENRVMWAERNLQEVKERYDPQVAGMADVLRDSEKADELVGKIEHSMESEFDQERWDEFVAENAADDSEFERIRDFQTSATRSKQDRESGEWHEIPADDPNTSHQYMYGTMLPKATTQAFKPFAIEPFYKEEAFVGRYASEHEGVLSGPGVLPAHGIEITDEMADAIRSSQQELFQMPVDGSKVPKGAIEFLKGTMQNPEAVAIRLFDDADASTIVHELGHVALYDLNVNDLRVIENELQGGMQLADWGRPEYERFARSFERHVMGEPAMNPALTPIYRHLAEIMQNIYKAVKGYFDDLPVSPAVEDVFDRLINPRSIDEARTYFPHRSVFDIQQTAVLGGTRLPAGGRTLGVPKQDRRAFPNKANAEVLWETGEMNPSTHSLNTQVIRRGRYHEALRIRRSLYKEGHEIKADQGIPPGAYLVRDPEMRMPRPGGTLKRNPLVERIPDRVTAATRLDEQSFRELTGDADIEDWQDALKNIVMTPDELADVGIDMKHVRWVEPWKVESAVRNVFPSSPKGRGAAGLGMLNTTTRLAQIYMRPLRYLTGNIPANVVLVALTNPSAMPRSMQYLATAIRNSAREFGKGPADLSAHHPGLYNAIRAESGDVMAGAGLPEFYTQANNGFQKSERRLNRVSQEISDRLGEIADQPFRVAVWITWAKRYGYKTPKDWEHLLARRLEHDPSGRPARQLSPEEERVRDEIAQRTREDMIDFNAMTPWERQHIGRFFYLWAFTRGFIKWPLTFAREYPERLAAIGIANEAIGEQERELPTEYYDARGQSTIRRPDGTGLDFSSWNPISGGVDAWNTIAGLAQGNVRGITDYISPALTAAGEAMFDPTNPQGWGEVGKEALGTFAPAWGQQAISKATGMETPASRRSEATGIKGVWKEVNDIIELDRFSQGRYSPSITKQRTADWKDLTSDYSVTTANYSADAVTKAYQAYWRYKEYEQRVKYGIAEREGRQGLSDKEKAIVLRRVALEVYGEEDVASISEINKADADDLKEFVEAMDWMWKARTSVMSAATRRRNETAASRKAAGVQN